MPILRETDSTGIECLPILREENAAGVVPLSEMPESDSERLGRL